MNITELARKLRVSTEELRVLLPKLGFDIGQRAIKIADQAARKIVKEWPVMIKRLKDQEIKKEEEEKKGEEKGIKEAIRAIILPAKISVRELATRLNVPIIKLIQELIKNGILINVNEQLDFETAAIVAEDLGWKVSKGKKEIIESLPELMVSKEIDKSKLKPRPPVVVVMGHVDHGKTRLLDTIRKTNIMAGEAGGITQHIGAYQAEKNGRQITFLDTPGHEAFISMRSRGAKVADLAILVVAADDGVQPQTIEAIQIIQAAKLPFVVAINKIDKPGADPEKIKRQLSDLTLIPEEWGGKTICAPISAKMGQGIDELLETVLLVADFEKDRLMAVFDQPAVGTIIESHRDPGEGIVATLLIQAGELKIGDVLAVGNIHYGKVKAMWDFLRKPLSTAYPSQPVKILGFRLLPEVGSLVAVKEEKGLERQKMKEPLRTFLQKKDEETLRKPTIYLMLKADVLGSLEAIVHELEKLKIKEVDLKIIDQSFGNIRESDVLKAKAQDALIFGFQVEIEAEAKKAAVETGVKIFISKIIYELKDAVKKEIEKLLPPTIKEVSLGKITVLKIFRHEGNEMIMGGRVTDGTIKSGTRINIIRGAKRIGQGEICEIRRADEQLPHATSGMEIGLKIKTSIEIRENDLLEVYREEKEARKLL